MRSRFVLFLALKEFYSEHPSVLDDAAGLILEDLRQALLEGIHVNFQNQKILVRFCICGIKGDLPFLIESGHLERHFRRAPRRGDSTMFCPGVCHLCMAGATMPNGKAIPYEDFSENPAFEGTMKSAASAAPWHSLPPFLALPGFDSRRPYLWRPDIFHNLHLGHGKYFLSSALIVLAQFQDGGGVEARLQSLTDQWLGFCKRVKVTCQPT